MHPQRRRRRDVALRELTGFADAHARLERRGLVAARRLLLLGGRVEGDAPPQTVLGEVARRREGDVRGPAHGLAAVGSVGLRLMSAGQLGALE